MTDTVSRYPAKDDTRSLFFVRKAQDGQTHQALGANPSHQDAMADIANDESFPASDAPSHSPADHG